MGGRETEAAPPSLYPSSFIDTLLDFPAQRRERCGEFLLKSAIVHTRRGPCGVKSLSTVYDFPPLFPVSQLCLRFPSPFLASLFFSHSLSSLFSRALSGSSPDNFLKSLCFPPLFYHILTSIFPVFETFLFQISSESPGSEPGLPRMPVKLPRGKA